MVKGLEALLFECVMGASQFGADELVWASLNESFPGIDWKALADYTTGRVVVHGERRAREMEEVAETLRAIGVSTFVPVTVPEMTTTGGGFGVESTVFFDEYARAGRMKEARGGGRPNGRLISAVDYLQAQRVRMMMMTKLAEATSHVDVYVVASNNNGRGGPGGRGAGRGAADTPPPPQPERLQTPAQRHSNMANSACYPAINVPNGFSETGSPTNMTFYAQPFREMDILALAKVYQDAAGFHLKRPTRLDG